MNMNLSISKRAGVCASIVIVSLLLLCLPAEGAVASNSPQIQHYKMVSTIEYTGKGRFRSEAGAFVTVKKQTISDSKVRYTLTSQELDLDGSIHGHADPSDYDGLTFVYDRYSKEVSNMNENLAGFQERCNSCVPALTDIPQEKIGKTWKQTYEEICFAGNCYSDMKYTVTAKLVNTEALGDMVAVRALSEPITLTVTPEDGKKQKVKLRANSFYLFDSQMEKIYLSVLSIEETTRISGFNEKVRYETGTYMTDARGNSIDLTGLDKKFAKFVSKVGLSRKELKIKEGQEVPIPAWVCSSDLGVSSVQTCNMASALACEGASNPVALIFLPTNQALGAQSMGAFGIAGGSGTVGATVVRNVSGMSEMQIVGPPMIFGVSHGTAATASAIGMGATAIGGNVGDEAWGGDDGDDGDIRRRPATPIVPE